MPAPGAWLPVPVIDGGGAETRGALYTGRGPVCGMTIRRGGGAAGGAAACGELSATAVEALICGGSAATGICASGTVGCVSVCGAAAAATGSAMGAEGAGSAAIGGAAGLTAAGLTVAGPSGWRWLDTPASAGAVVGPVDLGGATTTGGFTTTVPAGGATTTTGLATTLAPDGALATTGPVGGREAIAGGAGGVTMGGALRGCGTILRGSGRAGTTVTGGAATGGVTAVFCTVTAGAAGFAGAWLWRASASASCFLARMAFITSPGLETCERSIFG